MWTVKLDESLNAKYIDVIHKQYMKNTDGLNNRSRVMLLENAHDCYMHMLYGEKIDDCIKGVDVKECNNELLKVLQLIFGKDNFDDNYVMHEKIMNDMYNDRETSPDKLPLGQFNELQDIVFYLYNIAFEDKTLYAGICGSVAVDMITEYIFIDPFKNLTWRSSYGLTQNGFRRYDQQTNDIQHILDESYVITDQIEDTAVPGNVVADNNLSNKYLYKSVRKINYVVLVLLLIMNSNNVDIVLNFESMIKYIFDKTDTTTVRSQLIHEVVDKILTQFTDNSQNYNCDNYAMIRNDIINKYLLESSSSNEIKTFLKRFLTQSIMKGGNRNDIKLLYIKNKSHYIKLQNMQSTHK